MHRVLAIFVHLSLALVASLCCVCFTESVHSTIDALLNAVVAQQQIAQGGKGRGGISDSDLMTLINDAMSQLEQQENNDDHYDDDQSLDGDDYSEVEMNDSTMVQQFKQQFMNALVDDQQSSSNTATATAASTVDPVVEQHQPHDAPLQQQLQQIGFNLRAAILLQNQMVETAEQVERHEINNPSSPEAAAAAPVAPASSSAAASSTTEPEVVQLQMQIKTKSAAADALALAAAATAAEAAATTLAREHQIKYSHAIGPALERAQSQQYTSVAVHRVHQRLTSPFDAPQSPFVDSLEMYLLSHDDQPPYRSLIQFRELVLPLQQSDATSSGATTARVKILQLNDDAAQRMQLSSIQVKAVMHRATQHLRARMALAAQLDAMRRRAVEQQAEMREAREIAAIQDEQQRQELSGALESDSASSATASGLAASGDVATTGTATSSSSTTSGSTTSGSTTIKTNRTHALLQLLARAQAHRFGLDQTTVNKHAITASSATSASSTALHIQDMQRRAPLRAAQCLQVALFRFDSNAARVALGEMSMRGEGAEDHASLWHRIAQRLTIGGMQSTTSSATTLRSLQQQQQSDTAAVCNHTTTTSAATHLIGLNYSRAFELFQHAASSIGNAQAQYNLALMYAWGVVPTSHSLENSNEEQQQQQHSMNHAMSVLYTHFSAASHHMQAKQLRAYRLTTQLSQTSSAEIEQYSSATDDPIVLDHRAEARCDEALPLYRSVAKHVIDRLDAHPALRFTLLIQAHRLTSEGESQVVHRHDERDAIDYHSTTCHNSLRGISPDVAASSCVQLGYLYLHGVRGFAQNHSEARRLFCRAAELRHLDAQVMCAQMLLHSIGISPSSSSNNRTRDTQRAIALFESAASKNSSSARAALASLYLYGTNSFVDAASTPLIVKNQTRAFALLKQASDTMHQPSADAQFLLGLLYYNPNLGLRSMYDKSVVVKRLNTALQHWSLAAAAGHPRAAYHLAQMHQAALGGAVVQCEAAMLLYKHSIAERASEWALRMNDAHALVLRGRRVEAWHLYAEWAELGSEVAQWNSAVLLLARGRFAVPLFMHLSTHRARVQHKRQLALRHLHMAAEQHNVDAWRLLGDWHYSQAVALSEAAAASTAEASSSTSHRRAPPQRDEPSLSPRRHMQQAVAYYRRTVASTTRKFLAQRRTHPLPLAPLVTHESTMNHTVAHAAFSLALILMQGFEDDGSAAGASSSGVRRDVPQARRLLAQCLALQPRAWTAVRLAQARLFVEEVAREVGLWPLVSRVTRAAIHYPAFGIFTSAFL